MPLATSTALETTLQDIRYAVRGFARNRMFAFTVIMAAGLGVGATTAVFSVVDRILFRALPYGNEKRLVSVGMTAPLDSNEFMFASEYFDLRHDPGPFEAVTSFQAGAVDCDLTEQNPLRLQCVRVEAGFLQMFGMSPLLGRMYTREEDRPHGARVAMISEGLWRSRFASDPRVLERTIPIDGEPTLVVGVLPQRFEMPTLTQADILLPLNLNEASERSGRALRVFALLKSGLTSTQARVQLQPHFQRALATVPAQFRKEIGLRVVPVRDRQVGDVKLISVALFGAVLAVLLIACANIANLLLARAVARDREVAVRAALGASRLRLIRQTLTESVLLGSIGGVLGCGLAYALLRVFIAIAPGGLPWLDRASIDWRVLLFALTAAIASGLVFGMVPALRSPGAALLGGSRVTGHGKGGLRTVLVTAQIAISMMLLTGAGLLLRSLSKLESVPLGLQADHVLVARIVLGKQRYSNAAEQLAFFNELERRLPGLPGVEAVAITDSVPPSGGRRGRPFSTIDVEGRPRIPEGTGGMVAWRYVTPGYFSSLRIPILRGRPFTRTDRDPEAYGVILSNSLAQRLFPQGDAVGKRILKGPQGQWFTVVGIAGDVRNLGPAANGQPEYYMLRKPSADFVFQRAEPPIGWRAASILARTAIDPKLVANSIRSVIASLDSTLPVQMETMPHRLDEITQRPRFNAVLLSLFAAMGLALAAIGLFGVMSFLVAQRTPEIGVRMALGATPAHVMMATLRQSARWTAAGVIAGLGGSILMARTLQSLLFQVQPGDPRVIGASLAVLCLVSVLAAVGPARRAARLDPMVTLRQD